MKRTKLFTALMAVGLLCQAQAQDDNLFTPVVQTELRAPSVPLVTSDPYFSIWSGADHLYDADPEHWCGARQQMRGYVTVDGAVSCFLGDREYHEVIPQKEVEVTPTSTEYRFENEKIILTVRFTSPLLADDLHYDSYDVEATAKITPMLWSALQ